MKPRPISMPCSDEFICNCVAGEVIHLWAKPAGAAVASNVEVTGSRGDSIRIGIPQSDDFQLLTHVVETIGKTRICWDAANTAVSVCYSFHPQIVQSEGIRLLYVAEAASLDQRRYRLHLSPPFGWMNDPNGMIDLDGRLHAFYQHYPHAIHWDTMHWGHAVSDNLIDWINLPIFLHPQPHMLVDTSKKGGAFSGSAIANRGGIRIFHTDREDGRIPLQEWQITAVSDDVLQAGQGTPVIAAKPPIVNFGPDLRDPYVFKGPDGLWKMVLGGADDTAALVLLYETADPDAATGWTFAGVLHREPLTRAVPAECPCLIALDGEGGGLYALAFGLIGHQTLVNSRLNPSYILVGHFDGRQFVELYRRDLDFVGDFYAFQCFRHRSTAMGIGWAANWADVKPGRDFPSAMSLPRQLVWKEGTLLMPPTEALEQLRLRHITATQDTAKHGAVLPDGLAEIIVSLKGPGAPFQLEFDHPTLPFTLRYDGAELVLDGPWVKAKARGLVYRHETKTMRSIHVVLDVGLIEVFVDGGLACGTKRIDSDEPVSAIRLVDADNMVEQLEIWQLRAKREQPRLHSFLPADTETIRNGA